MSKADKDAGTPRLFLIRHGETTWSRSGQYTGITDLPLLPDGESQVRSSAQVVFGAGKLIDPSKLTKIFVSPRQRARRTLALLLETADSSATPDEVEVTDEIAEWGYGDYEGKLTSEIRALRKSQGLDQERPWDIWVDGCTGPGGELPDQVAARLDRLIAQIQHIQGEGMKKTKMEEELGEEEEGKKGHDVLVVAHGHILRAFIKRWLGLPLSFGLAMMLEPGGVCGLSYQHGRLDEPAVLVGMSFPGASS